MTPEQEQIPIDTLELSVRSTNCLKNHGVATLGDLAILVAKGKAFVLKEIRHFGVKSWYECKHLVDAFNGQPEVPPRTTHRLSGYLEKPAQDAYLADKLDAVMSLLLSIAISTKRIADANMTGEERVAAMVADPEYQEFMKRRMTGS